MKIIKIALAIVLFSCLLNMPYGYYQLVRFISLIVFGYLAYQAHADHNKGMMFIYSALAVLFQPIFKISLGRELWNIIDVIVGVGLMITVIMEDKTKRENLS